MPPTTKQPATKPVDIWTIIRKRFPANEYAVIQEVRDAAGFSASRSADGIAMCLWPSRGLAINGIEVKSHRSDWLRELKNPKKAEAIYKYCDYWYLVTADDKVAKLEEIPETWGWLYVKGGKLYTGKEAPKLTPVTLDKGFVSSMLRRACEGTVPISSIEDKISEAYERGKNSKDYPAERLQKELDSLRANIDAFEQASGINLSYRGARLGEIVKTILHGGVEKYERRVSDLFVTSQGITNELGRFMDELSARKSERENEQSIIDTERVKFATWLTNNPHAHNAWIGGRVSADDLLRRYKIETSDALQTVST